MKKLLFVMLASFSFANVQAQMKVGNNPTSIGASSALEIESTNKALVITRVANTAAIASPVNGMLIYDLSSNCIKSYENGAWTNCLSNGSNIEASTNGTAIVSAYNCSTSSAGTISAGVPVSGVSQTITATVSQIGTYSLNTYANGVVFSGSGTFTALGTQNVILAATGTAVNTGNTNFTLNTLPTCTFSRTVSSNTSSGGSAVVSAYACNTASTGTIQEGTAVSGVTQTITATVTTAGTYSITTTASGVTFSGSGTFAGTGAQTIVLTASGTPTASGNISFPLSTTPGCSFTRTVNSITSFGTAVVSAYNCTGAMSNNMTVGISATGITKTITATVSTAGTYSITTPAVNGVSWAGTGTFAGTGAQTLTLTATGTPTATGCYTYTLNTTPACSFTSYANGNGTTSTTASASCKQIKTDFPSSSDGVYWLDLDQCGSTYAATQMYCDMTTSGGGWTLVLKSMTNDATFTYNSTNWSNSGVTLNKTDFNLTGTTNSIYDAYTGLSGSTLRLDFLTIPDITINLASTNSTYFHANNKSIINSSLTCKTTEPSFYGGTGLWDLQRGSTVLGTNLVGSPAQVKLGIIADNTASTDVTNLGGWDSGVGLGVLGASTASYGSGVVSFQGDTCPGSYGGAVQGFYKCLVWMR